MGAAVDILMAGSLAIIPAQDSTPPPAESRTMHATAGQMLDLAEQFARRGSLREAETILSLLSHDPNPDVRNEARFRLAKLLQSQGKTSSAAVLLRQIIDEKPDAAVVRLELAQLLEKLGDVDGALRQVRAAQAGGLPLSVARLVDRYSEALRASRPFGASFELGLAPDSNINRATRSDTLGTVFGNFDIGKESQARSGVGLELRGQAYRRFELRGDTRLLVRLSGSGDLYRASEFNDIAVDLAAGPELRIGRSRVNVEAGATQRWFGQKPFIRSVRLATTLAQPLGRRTQLRLSAAAAIVDNQLNNREDGEQYWGDASVERALSATNGVALTGSLARQSLKDPAYSTTSWRAGLLGWQDIGRMTLTAAAQYGRLHADERLVLFPEKRSEQYYQLSLGATFRRLTFHGFAPVARFTIERNRSSIAFYDYKRTRSEIGVTRAF